MIALALYILIGLELYALSILYMAQVCSMNGRGDAPRPHGTSASGAERMSFHGRVK